MILHSPETTASDDGCQKIARVLAIRSDNHDGEPYGCVERN